MNRFDRFEKDDQPVHVVLLALNGDVARAREAVRQRFPNATISDIPRARIEGASLFKRLQMLRAENPDVFAIFMESLESQRGQNVVKVFCALSGAKRLILMDARGGFKEERAGQVLLHGLTRFAGEGLRSSLAVINSRRRLAQLEDAVKTGAFKAPANLNFPPQILFLRATPGTGNQPGGAATHINGFVRTVRDQGAVLRMITNDRIAGLDERGIEVMIVPLESTGLTRSAFDLHNNLVFTDGVIDRIRQSPPDLIYQRYSRFTFAGVEAALRTERPLFLEYNGSEVWVGRHWDDAGMFSLLERFERLNLLAAARIFVVSEVERRNLLNAGIDSDKIVVNPNGVDVDVFRPGAGGVAERLKLGIDPGATLVGFTGTFGPWHGVLELAQAITQIPKQSGLHFLLIGSGQLLEQTREVIREAGILERVTFTGSVDHSRMPALLDACDILVSPHVPLAANAEFFGSPTKIFEYMAMGKGIVASRLGQIGEVLSHEETALLVEPGNVEELSKALVRLAESESLLDLLGQAARCNAIEHHTWKRNAQIVLDAYHGWLRESKEVMAEVADNELREEKQRARKQWGSDPAGAVYGRDHEFGSKAFFDEVERHRYQEYAPWMPEVMGFSDHAGDRLLEVGCGMGTDLLQFARGGAICTGVDLTPRSIEISRHRFKLYGVPGAFLIADGERLPFPDNSFDVVYSNGVLHHTPDTAGAVQEIHRVLRPGGIAKVMLYYRHSLNYWGEIMLHRGLLRGQLLRGDTPQQIMGRFVEVGEETDPLVKVYSRAQARQLFKSFSTIEFEVDQLIRAEFYAFGRMMPESIFNALRKRFGWNLIITATK